MGKEERRQRIVRYEREQEEYGKPEKKPAYFTRDGKGRMVYSGRFYELEKGGRTKNRMLLPVGGLLLACLALVVVSGIPAIPGTAAWYVIVPEAAAFVSGIFSLWKLGSLLFAKEPVAEYVYDQDVRKLGPWITALAASSACGALTEAFYLLLHGGGEKTAAAAVYLVAMALSALFARSAGKRFGSLEWKAVSGSSAGRE